MESKLTIFLDFDGTISKNDICFSMVERYAAHGWEKINQLWESGMLSTIDCAQQTLDLMTVQPLELEEFFRNMLIDESFPEFVNWTNEKNYPLYIISDGYDNYIKVLLAKHQLYVPYYANHLIYKEGWQIKSPHYNADCQKCGVCKTRLIKRLSQPEFLKIYVGDGYSDQCAIKSADVVFAKDKLAKYCLDNKISFYHYKNFKDIKTQIEELTKQRSKNNDF